MLSLEVHHITNLYVFVDDSLPKAVSSGLGGRPPKLTNSEMVTILIWNVLSLKQETLKDIYRSIRLYHLKEFPDFPSYSTFVDHAHKVFPHLVFLLQSLLSDEAPLRFLDSTMIPVCRKVRADSHKVAAGIADFGKNWQGWHFGFKLHASIDHESLLSQIAFSPASTHDAQMMPKILNKYCKIAVGDSTYGASVMGKKIREEYGTIVLAPPHYKQKKKVLTAWQLFLLRSRPKVESVFDYLKQHLHLVSSFPRSVMGYFLHYVRILLGYQILALSSLK
jgi:hypothetical protein